MASNNVDQAARARQMREDMAAVITAEPGKRLMKRLLVSLGYGQFLATDAAAVANHNFATALARIMLEANEGTTLQIMANALAETTKESR